MRNILYSNTLLLFLCCFCLLCLAAACTGDDEVTPQPSTEEHTTLRCKINGEDWTPASSGLLAGYPFDLEYYSYDGFLRLLTWNSSLETSISIGSSPIKLGRNSITENDYNWHFTNGLNSSGCKDYEDLEVGYNNHLTIIEIDSIDYFIIGKFEFSALNSCADTVRITEGYFDLKYHF